MATRAAILALDACVGIIAGCSGSPISQVTACADAIYNAVELHGTDPLKTVNTSDVCKGLHGDKLLRALNLARKGELTGNAPWPQTIRRLPACLKGQIARRDLLIHAMAGLGPKA